VGDVRIFKKSSSHLRILGVRKVMWDIPDRGLHEGPAYKIQLLWWPGARGFVHSCNKYLYQ